MYKLNNNNEIPLLGLGTFQVRSTKDDDIVYRVLETALQTGYKLIDTASCYRNEKDIGNGLQGLYKDLGICREDIFITSKLAPKDMGYDSALKTCQQTLQDLQTEYIDLYLIHWPGRSKLKPDDTRHADYRKETWCAFQEMYKQGYVKNIGVSNYTINHLEELLGYAEVLPTVNQVEFHPQLYQKDLLDYCREKNIFLQAYSSLGTGKLIDIEQVEDIAKKYHCTTSQILLRWALQKNVGILPKSVNPLRIKSNFNLQEFTLADEDMKDLDNLNTNTHYCWDPSLIK